MIAITLPSDTAQEAYYASAGRRYLPERLDRCQVFTNTEELINVTISRVQSDCYHEYYVYAVSDDARLWLWTGTEPVAHLVGSHGLLATDISVLPLAARLAYYDRLHQERQGEVMDDLIAAESAEWWDSLLAAVDAETAEPVYRVDCDDDGTCRVCGAPCGSTHLSDCRTYHVEYNPDRVAFDVVAYHAATDTFTTLDAGLSATEADRRVRQLREGR